MVAVVLLLASATGCSGAQLAEERDGVFSQAVEASLQGDATFAARAANHYLRSGTVDDPRYDRAIRLLADNLRELNLSYGASLWYFEIASARRDVELVEDAVVALAEIIETYPHDQWTLIDGFVATADISGLTTDAQAFVHYHQGLHSLRQGQTEWTQGFFDKLPEDSPYKARARYVMAVDQIADYQLEAASEELESILEDFEGDLPEDLSDDIHRALARLAFEEERFEEALERYQSIRETAPDDPNLLLEMAWTEFYLHNYRRSLGLLLALDAPSFQNLIAPERFMLEALNLQQLCQFEPARTAVVRLAGQYGQALDDLRQGMPLNESQALRSAARLREASEDLAGYRLRLIRERELVERNRPRLGGQLSNDLADLYDRALTEVDRREQELLSREMEQVAMELLGAAEGVRLILHEISVALLRGRDRVEGTAPSAVFEVPRGGEQVFYKFTGEFWTDEIDDLIVPLEDRCIE